MIEYIFFDAALRDKFVARAEQHDVACTLVDDALGLVVEIPEDLPDEVADELEDYYAELEKEQADLSRSEGELNNLAGFRFTLPNGESRMLPLHPDMAGRLLASFNLEEIQTLLEAVAACALEPDSKNLCQVLAERPAQD